ncbi:MAG: protein phosphatase 2C domain-containing protein [Methylomonas sp.]|jgi:protein phosphatase|uniref:PP2C family protein-serine/threonine phosphatase n=1 Tax=Methylomonas sp. TaxID=418 RepID=UPI0025DE15A3|nr:protein phosphatase 2C domain-containing protein [Methylomonas sp.]MCK9606911.1 protein phosphatase 2C domain-containing protein [Methylomonas sp.]
MTVGQVLNRYYVVGKTDCGRRRDHNEDTILINHADGLILLADGMGGHQYGDKASFEATQLVNQLAKKYLADNRNPQKPPGFWEKLAAIWHKSAHADQLRRLETHSQIIADILVQTNQAIYNLNQEAQMIDSNGMGTTLVGCKFYATQAKMHVFHVGDSRLYRWRDDQLIQVTKDHSAYQIWLDNGQIGQPPRSNIILQGIGPNPTVKPAVQILDIAASDSFLLCSDGLTDMVEDVVIATTIKGVCKDNIEQKAQQLIDLANQNGGSDNISVILICQ